MTHGHGDPRENKKRAASAPGGDGVLEWERLHNITQHKPHKHSSSTAPCSLSFLFV